MIWIPVKLVSTPRGTVLANLNDRVRSLNPSHATPPYGPYIWADRAPGANGGYELCAVNGGTVAYSPLGGSDPNAELFLFPFIAEHPTLKGYSGLIDQPLKIEVGW